MILKNLKKAKPDPIFGLYEAFLQDKRREKINLGIGIYTDQKLHHWPLPCVEKARQELAQKPVTADYLPIEGEEKFTKLLSAEILGKNLSNKIVQVQTLGGTGALSLAASFCSELGIQKVFFPDPTWANHKNIFLQNSFTLASYSYYCSKEQKITFSELFAVLQKQEEPSIVLLHAVCHNPTGQDFSKEEWGKLADLFRTKKNFIPLFDLAYHGLGEDEVTDLYPIRLFEKENFPFLVAYSCSKNFGLYQHRLGMLLGHFEEEETAEKALSQWKFLIRANYSNPPSFGAQLVKKILEKESLKKAWYLDLQTMRERITSARTHFTKALKNTSLNYLLKQKGMFSLLPLSAKQTEELKEKYAIYLPASGRINFCGINENNLEKILQALHKVGL